jgi:hypothetical protein
MAGPQGGDTRIDVTQGEAIPVASCSFDPGYSLESNYQGGDKRNKFTKADLVQGYCSYGRRVGE